jgi:hypothetical protein
LPTEAETTLAVQLCAVYISSPTTETRTSRANAPKSKLLAGAARVERSAGDDAYRRAARKRGQLRNCLDMQKRTCCMVETGCSSPLA